MTSGGTKVVALRRIERTVEPGKRGDTSKGIPATPPKVQVIKKGTSFVSSGDELAGLRAAKAVRPYNKDEDVGAPEAAAIASSSDSASASQTDTEGGGKSSGGKGGKAGSGKASDGKSGSEGTKAPSGSTGSNEGESVV